MFQIECECCDRKYGRADNRYDRPDVCEIQEGAESRGNDGDQAIIERAQHAFALQVCAARLGADCVPYSARSISDIDLRRNHVDFNDYGSSSRNISLSGTEKLL